MFRTESFHFFQPTPTYLKYLTQTESRPCLVPFIVLSIVNNTQPVKLKPLSHVPSSYTTRPVHSSSGSVHIVVSPCRDSKVSQSRCSHSGLVTDPLVSVLRSRDLLFLVKVPDPSLNWIWGKRGSGECGLSGGSGRLRWYVDRTSIKRKVWNKIEVKFVITNNGLDI